LPGIEDKQRPSFRVKVPAEGDRLLSLLLRSSDELKFWPEARSTNDLTLFLRPELLIASDKVNGRFGEGRRDRQARLVVDWNANDT
jgi:hypothetical protein